MHNISQHSPSIGAASAYHSQREKPKAEDSRTGAGDLSKTMQNTSP